MSSPRGRSRRSSHVSLEKGKGREPDAVPGTDASRHTERRSGRDMVDIWNPPRKERAMLVGHTAVDGPDLGRSLDELALLADTAGAEVHGTIIQRRGRISPKTFIGKGKLEELRDAARDAEIDLVIFNDDLSPPQIRNLETSLDIKVVDRSELILDIFARRARSRESRLQVELAQLQYQLPRLTGMWKHLERQAGGIGTRGPGETQLEVDRRRVRERIAALRRQLEGVERERETQRRRRRGEFRAALVGYTNAGKSTLFNALTRADVFVENRLFATLDATTRQMVSADRTVALLTDTVGFIRKLPHHLVASFHSTLIEAIEADLLLHVVDVADPDSARQIQAVDSVLEDLLETPRPTQLVFNKADLVTDTDEIAGVRAQHPGAEVVSALTGEGLDALRAQLWGLAAERRRAANVAMRASEAAATNGDAGTDGTAAATTEAPGDAPDAGATPDGPPEHTLYFEATIPAGIERVFRALTEGHHLEHWFCDHAASERGHGGALRLEWDRPGATAEPYVGRWTEWNAPFSCAFHGGHSGYPDGDAGRVTFTLDDARAGATLLIVRHTMPETPAYAGWIESYRGAWPRALERLGAYVTPAAPVSATLEKP
jgi:GTP-binding protein HflX